VFEVIIFIRVFSLEVLVMGPFLFGVRLYLESWYLLAEGEMKGIIRGGCY
jgi:hypothetical protein